MGVVCDDGGGGRRRIVFLKGFVMPLSEVQQTLLHAVKWDQHGLVCAVVQDVHSLRVLMVAWMNAEALCDTVRSGFAHYYSRSRRKQWMKGEESGHTQQVHELRLDCDGDALVLLVTQNGGMACHTGRESCFFRIWDGQQWHITDAVLKDEMAIYGHTHTHE